MWLVSGQCFLTSPPPDSSFDFPSLLSRPASTDFYRLESYGIEDVRTLQNWLILGSGPKIAFIPQAQNLTPQSQNALLKILEEPPTNTTIILQVSDPDSLLPTVLSRCQLVILPPSDPPASTEEREKAAEFLAALDSDDLGQCFKMVSLLAKDRTSAIASLEALLRFLHQQQKYPPTKEVFPALVALRQNANVRLTLENLCLNW